MIRSLAFLVIFFLSCHSVDDLFETIKSESDIIKQYFDDKAKYEIQILYTQIDRDQQNQPTLTSYTYNYDSLHYFYPASTVKMPVAFLALQKLKELGVDKWVTMKTDSSRAPQSSAYVDTTSSTGLPSVAHYIEKIFAVSNNDAYNRLYEFVGQDYINQSLRQKKVFSNSRIVTRVGIGGFSTEDNTHTNPVSFFDKADQLIHSQPATQSIENYFFELSNTHKGKGYYDDNLDTVIYEAFDMSKKNFVNLKDLESSMTKVLFPEIFPVAERFDINDDDYTFLYQAMQKTPREHAYLHRHLDEYYDSYVKFFMFGDSKGKFPDNIRIFNKVGYAYGYLTDCAYIIDTENNIEFLLTATVHVNENEIFNDGKYQYEDGIKFLAELGREIYKIEKSRVKKHKANLSKYLIPVANYN